MMVNEDDREVFLWVMLSWAVFAAFCAVAIMLGA